jgi:hypothetical protein
MGDRERGVIRLPSLQGDIEYTVQFAIPSADTNGDGIPEGDPHADRGGGARRSVRVYLLPP